MEIEITEENKYSTTDISKWIRQQIKKEFGKDIKTSIVTSLYSGGSSINISIIESKTTRFIKTFEEIEELEILRLQNARNDTREEIEDFIKNRLNTTHYNINQYYVEEDTGLTEKGKQIISKILNIANKHNWDKSDVQTDYFDVNYYLNISLGKWDKPFTDGVE